MSHLRPAGIALALVLAASLAPLAAADHAYSHRYIVWGRVVDAAGVGVGGIEVTAEPQGMTVEGPCPRQPHALTDAYGPMRTRNVTDEAGDFVFCYHAHTLARESAARFVVIADEIRVEAPVDPLLREHFVLVTLPDPRDVPSPNEHVVLGRVWRASTTDLTVEAIRVYGDVVARTPVNVSLTVTGTTIENVTLTDGFGNFAIRIPLSDSAPPSKVHIAAANTTWDLNAGEHGITYVRAAIAAPEPAPSTPTTPASPSAPAPRSTTTTPASAAPTPHAAPEAPTPLSPWIALAAASLTAIAARRRR